MTIYDTLSSAPIAAFKGLTIGQVQAGLEKARQSPTECDGCSRLVAHELSALGIENLFIAVGRCHNIVLNQVIDPHWWGEVVAATGDENSLSNPQRWVIDYRNPWLKQEQGILTVEMAQELGLRFEPDQRLKAERLHPVVHAVLLTPFEPFGTCFPAS